jgi:hypothetical protein
MQKITVRRRKHRKQKPRDTGRCAIFLQALQQCVSLLETLVIRRRDVADVRAAMHLCGVMLTLEGIL